MKKRAKAAFKAYTGRYDVSDSKIKLKIDHTYRVAEIAEAIARDGDIDLEEYNVDFCWLLGLLHDIGRFEQLTRYGTFKDDESVDHAEFGADILFKGIDGEEPLIDTFIDPADWLDPECPDVEWEEMVLIAESAIRLHNKLVIPEDLGEDIRLFADILRDADKIDIFRVISEPPYDERNARIVRGSVDGSIAPARDDIMRCVYEHRCVPKAFKRTDFESLISQCCMALELAYPISRKMVRKQGYLYALMNLPVRDPAMAEQLGILQSEVKKVWEEYDHINNREKK